MTADNDKAGAPASDQQSPIQRETDEGDKIIPGAEITLPEGDEEATITEQEDGAQPEDGQQPAAVAQPDKRGKNRVPAKQRINQLWHEARQAETRAEQLERENTELKAQMAQKDTHTAEVNAGAMVAHESSWKNARDLARRELIDAKGAADPVKEADAIAKLSRAEAELANIEAWKAAQPKPKANGAAEPQPQQRQQQNGNGQAQPQPVQLSPEIQEWVNDNRWMVNDPNNPDFDQEMASYAAAQATVLEQRMRRQGKANEVGTQTYFDEMDRLMREEFPDRFDDTEDQDLPQPQPKPQPRQQPANQRRAPQMARTNGAAAVAPASQSSSQAATRAQPRTVNLSAEERGFAHQMAANGALRYPVGHKMAGKQMQPADAEIAYARQKLNQTVRS